MEGSESTDKEREGGGAPLSLYIYYKRARVCARARTRLYIKEVFNLYLVT